MLYAIAYDIVDDRRRGRVARVLRGYGERVQRSVFECLLDPEVLADLLRRVDKEIDPAEDRIRVYPICKACSEKVVIRGSGELTKEVEVYIV